jgi:hypothetical protein
MIPRALDRYTWAGTIVKTETVTSTAGKLSVTVPDLSQVHRDIAVKIDKK